MTSTSRSNSGSDRTTPTPADPVGARDAHLFPMFPRAEEEEWALPIGEIHLPGDQIVSHRHRALDRFEEWQRINHSRIRNMGTRQRWDLYISDPAFNMLAAPSPGSSPEEKEESQVVGAPALKMHAMDRK